MLRTHGREQEAKAVIEQAAAKGITYFDSAQAYAGSQGYYGNFWRGHQELRSGIFQTNKSAARDYQGAKADLAVFIYGIRILAHLLSRPHCA